MAGLVLCRPAGLVLCRPAGLVLCRPAGGGSGVGGHRRFTLRLV